MITTNEKSSKRVLFHEKRSDLTCEGVIDGGFDPGYISSNFIFTFENIDQVIENSGNKNFCDEYDIPCMANNWDDEYKQWFNDLKIININESDEEETVYITADDLGDAVILNAFGLVACTYEESGAIEGTFEVNGSYEQYYWKPFSELNEKEMLLFANHHEKDDLIRELYPNDVDELIILIIENGTCFRNSESVFAENYTLDELVRDFNISIVDAEEEAESEHSAYIEINDKYYCID